MRRALLPGFLAVIVIASLLAAWRNEAAARVAPSAPIDTDTDVRASTPVLSARRVPSLVRSFYGDRKLREGLTSVVARSPADTCLLVSIDGRGVAFAHDPGNLQTPASVQKLLTAVAALDALAPDATLRTVAAAGGRPVDGVLAGDLWFVGGGDPLLATESYAKRFRRQPQIYTPIETLADALVEAGVREIGGAVVGDDGRFDRERYLSTWPARYVNQNQSGPLSALLVNDGFVAFPPGPDVSTPRLEPASEPPLHAAQVLTNLLRERGVTVRGEARSGRAEPGAVELASISSRPVAEIVTEMLRESDNTTAELLVKELGRVKGAGPTTAAGLEVMRATLAPRGLVSEGAVFADGSGLARDNQVSCSTISALLEQAGAGSPLASGLAVAGESGTLAGRFKDTLVAGRLRAKTGTLSQAMGLAGFVESIAGVKITFSYLVNVAEPQQLGRSEESLQDELGVLLAGYPDAPEVGALSPLPAAAEAPG